MVISSPAAIGRHAKTFTPCRIALGAGLCAATRSPTAAATGTPRFATSGRWIIDGAGRKLVLRGLNAMGAEFTATNRPLPYGPADFAAMAASGATVVRLPIAWANIEPTPGHYDAGALARARTIVQQAG